MQYSIYPTRALLNEDNQRMIEGLRQLADSWGVDLTNDLKHDQPIDQIMKGQDDD